MPRAKPTSISLMAAIDRFLADKQLDGHEQVTAALLVELARSFEEAPAYARGRLGVEVRACLDQLQYALQRNEERESRRRVRSWVQDGEAA